MSGDGIVTDIRVAETLRVEVPSPEGPRLVTITLEHKSGQVARLRVRAPDDVVVGKKHSRFPLIPAKVG